MDYNNVINKINSKKSKIGIIGLGYIGIPLALRFVDEGFKVFGFDIDKDKVNQLKKGKTYIKNIPSVKISNAIKNGFIPLTIFESVGELDAIIICVPTPLDIDKNPDLSYIEKTLDSIKPFLKRNQILILESTTYPGTTEEKIIPMINSMGFNIGLDFFIGYSPEREDPGNKDFNTKNIPKVVSGFTQTCLKVINCLYSKVVEKTIPVKSIKAAEMTKIFENIHRAVNIGLVNEMKIVADKMNINFYEVIQAASSKPFGFTPYYPGPGIGGHCIPIDPFYLTWKAKEIGVNTRFIQLAGEINESIPDYIVEKIIYNLNKIDKSVKNSRILVLGVAYKKNVDDLRESPALKIIDELIKMKASVAYSDPHVPSLNFKNRSNNSMKSVELTSSSIISFDLVLLTTDHDDFDYKLIQDKASLIIDTRGRYKPSKKIIL